MDMSVGIRGFIYDFILPYDPRNMPVVDMFLNLIGR